MRLIAGVLIVWMFILFMGHEKEQEPSFVEQALVSFEENSSKFELLPDVLKEDEAFLKKALKKNAMVLEYLDEQYRSDKEWVLWAVKHNGLALKHANNMLKSDEEIVLESVKESSSSFEYAHPYLKKNRAYVLKLLREERVAIISYVDATLQADKELVEIALAFDDEAFNYLDEAQKTDKAYLLKFIRTNAWILFHLDERLKADKEIVRAAVMDEEGILIVADEALYHDKAFLETLIEEDDKVLESVPNELWKDNAFLLPFLKTKGFGLQYATKEQQDDRALVLKAIERDGYALEYASDRLKKDEALVLKAIDSYSAPLQFADSSLKNDREFVKKAIAVHPYTTVSLGGESINDKELASLCVKQNAEVLSSLPELKKDKSFIIEMLEKNINVLPYIDASLKNDAEILEASKHFPTHYETLERVFMLVVILLIVLFFYLMFMRDKKYFRLLVLALVFLVFIEMLQTYFAHGVFRVPYKMMDENNKIGLERIKCWAGEEEGLSRMECYDMHVPEIYDDPESRMITFPVRVFRSEEWFTSKSPILHLGGGGPGAAMGLENSYSLLYRLISHDDFSVNQKRDLFIIDPRGAGLSKPLLTCDVFVDNLLKNMRTPLSLLEESQRTTKEYAECVRKFKASDVNFNGYNSMSVAQDMNALKEVANVEKWVLFGVSYSTTYAMFVAKQYPEMVESMILDSACFPNLKLDHNYIQQQNDRYEALYDYQKNRKEKVEKAGTPDIKERIWALHGQLNREPIEMDYLDLQLNGNYFIGSLLEGVYGTSVFHDLPQIISDLESNKTKALEPYFKNYMDFLSDRTYGDVSAMAHYCYEDKPFIDFEKIRKELNQLPESYIKRVALLNLDTKNLCKEMGIESNDKTLGDAIETDIPTLFVHGEFDSVTPLRDVHTEMKNFKNAKLLTYKTSHSVLGSEEKIERDIAEFVEGLKE